MHKEHLFVKALILAALFSCFQCNDVRIGNEGIVQCSSPGLTLVNVRRVTLTKQDVQVIIYNSGTNSSTDKYILAADFYTITVKSVTVRDEGEYVCQVTHRPFGNPRTVTTDTTLSVCGKYDILSNG